MSSDEMVLKCSSFDCKQPGRLENYGFCESCWRTKDRAERRRILKAREKEIWKRETDDLHGRPS